MQCCFGFRTAVGCERMLDGAACRSFSLSPYRPSGFCVNHITSIILGPPVFFSVQYRNTGSDLETRLHNHHCLHNRACTSLPYIVGDTQVKGIDNHAVNLPHPIHTILTAQSIFLYYCCKSCKSKSLNLKCCSYKINVEV